MTNRALLCIPVLWTFTFRSCRCLFVKFRRNLAEFRRNAQPSARYVATFSHPATHQQSKPLENSSVIPNNLKTDYCPSTSPSLCAVPHHFCNLLMGSSNKHISYGCTSRFSGTHHPIPQWLWTVDCCWVSTVGLYEEGMVSPTFTCIGHQLGVRWRTFWFYWFMFDSSVREISATQVPAFNHHIIMPDMNQNSRALFN